MTRLKVIVRHNYLLGAKQNSRHCFCNDIGLYETLLDKQRPKQRELSYI